MSRVDRLIEQELREFAAPRGIDRRKRYYHGTSTRKAGKEIIKYGIQPPDLTDRKGFLKPVEGRVYITPKLKEAVIYTLGANMIGQDMSGMMSFRGKTDVFGYLFVIEGTQLADIQPDEDDVGRLLSDAFGLGTFMVQQRWGLDYSKPIKDKSLWWLADLAKRNVAISRLNKLLGGEYAYWASVGKQLLRKMTDEQKLALIDKGANVANEGPIKPLEAWRFDKRRSQELSRDAGNFFQIAEQIR